MAHLVKGSPEAMERARKMQEGKLRKQEELINQFRSKHPELDDEGIQSKIKQWKRSQRLVKSAQRQADAMAREVERAAAPEEETGLQGSRNTLASHPVFGQSAVGGALTVKIYREPSTEELHNGPGICPGFLEGIPFDEFSESMVKARHGGGKFKVVAVDGDGRTLSNAFLTISGRAKSVGDDSSEHDDGDYPMPTRLSEILRHQQSQDEDRLLNRIYEENSRLREERRGDPQADRTDWEQKRQDERDRWDRERAEERSREERKRLDEERRYERMRDEDRRRSEDQWKQQQAAQSQQMQLFTALMQSQQQNMSTMVAVMGKKDDGGGLQAMGTIMESMTGIYGSLVDTIQASVQGEDKRSIAERVVTTLAQAGAPLIERVAETMNPTPTPPPAPEQNVQQVMTLPDGRSVPLALVEQFVEEYKSRNAGQLPSLETIQQGMATILNMQAQPQPQESQIVHAPSPPVSPRILFDLTDAFQAGQSPDTTLSAMIESGSLSPEIMKGIGGIYSSSGESVLTVILMKVFNYLSKHGVEAPPTFISVFQGSKAGKDWLDAFLSLCCSAQIEAAPIPAPTTATQVVQTEA